MSTSASDPSTPTSRNGAAVPGRGDHHGASPVDPRSQQRRVVDAQEERFGGIELGSASFGG